MEVYIFHHLCYKCHVIGGEPIAIYTGYNSKHRATTETLRHFRKSQKSPVILCPTRESNPRPLVRQSHLRTTRPTRQSLPQFCATIKKFSKHRKKPSNTSPELSNPRPLATHLQPLGQRGSRLRGLGAMCMYVCKRTYDTGENCNVGQRLKKRPRDSHSHY
ncbi:hypothetical protein SFRURICE_011772 [Spodoptera frugiperda]|nr:hypothetical protein SFRURICE_011772 [Spodoptera frugiperda]